MMDVIFEAPPRSSEDIENLADTVRRIVGLEATGCFPVLPFLEYALPHLVEGMVVDVLPKAELGRREGAVDPIARALYVREDVYEAAARDNGRARFTICHEIGHALMHVGTLNRAPPSAKVVTYKNPEWQANRFAAALLMPRGLVRKCVSVQQVVNEFLVSREAAELRAKVIGLNS